MIEAAAAEASRLRNAALEDAAAVAARVCAVVDLGTDETAQPHAPGPNVRPLRPARKTG
jgi:hypothetical protein